MSSTTVEQIDDDLLTSICSTVTLQSEKRGFFQNFAESVVQAAGEKWLVDFKNLRSDKDRVLNCLNHPKVRDVVQGTLGNVQKLFRTKNGPFAKSKREDASFYLHKKSNVKLALQASNSSVARAPLPEDDPKTDDGHCLSLALWTRAEILYSIKDFEHSLTDLQLSLKHKLPDNLKLDTYKKMMECYLKLGDLDKAKISVNIVLKLSKLEGNKQIEEEAEEILQNIDSHLCSKQESSKTELPELYENGSRTMPCLSSALSMRRSKDKGRYMVANVPIPVGACVAVEQPYASSLRFEKHGTHCLHCYARIKVFVPCIKCSGVAFCSVKCRDDAYYHRWECPFLELMMGSGMSASSQLSLRMITQSPLEYFLKFFECIRDNTSDHEYLKIYNLEAHWKTREPKDLLYRTLMALFLLQILRNSGYFSTFSSNGFESMTEPEIFVGCLLLRNLQLAQFNCHEMFESVVKPEMTEWTVNDSKLNYTAIAIYPSSAMLNHDCQPTLARCFVGKVLVMRTERPLHVGEEVTENYGPSFLHKPKDERQKILKARYHFTCNCQACREDWPIVSSLDHAQYRLKCATNSCSGTFDLSETTETAWRCPVCTQMNNLDYQKALLAAYKIDRDAALKMVHDKNEQVEKLLIKYLEEAHNLISQPNTDLCLAMESLRNYWATLGNFYKL